MEIGIDAEKDTLQSLIRSCLLELNKLKLDLTELEVEKANDTTPQRIKELEQDIVDKEKEVSVIKFKAEDEINLLKKPPSSKRTLISLLIDLGLFWRFLSFLRSFAASVYLKGV